MRVVRPGPGPGGPIVAAFLGGMAVGAALAVLLRPRSRGGSLQEGAEAVTVAVVAPEAGPRTRLRDEPPTRSVGGWRDRRAQAAPVELERLRMGLSMRHPGVEVEVGLLAPGIVEVVGEVGDPSTLQAILEGVREEPGVRTVLNRIRVAGDTL